MAKPKFVRRNIASEIPEPETSPASVPEMAVPESGSFSSLSSEPAVSPGFSPPTSALDMIRTATRRKRSRSWEQAHPTRTLRGVQANVIAAIAQIAENEGGSPHAVAEGLLEFAIRCYHRNELPVRPVLSLGRRTLFPAPDEDAAGRKRKQLHWTEKTWGLTPPKKRKAPPRKSPAGPVQDWRKFTGYRIAASTWDAFRAIRDYQSVKTGELFNYFVIYALDAYEAGRLVFEAVGEA